MLMYIWRLWICFVTSGNGFLMVSLPLGKHQQCLRVLFLLLLFLTFLQIFWSQASLVMCVYHEKEIKLANQKKIAYAWFSLLQSYVWVEKSHENVIRDFWRNNKLPKRDIKRIVRRVEMWVSRREALIMVG